MRRDTASRGSFVSGKMVHYLVVYRTANASLLNGVHGEARMTSRWVCSKCRLGLSRTRGVGKDGYMVDNPLHNDRTQRDEDIAVSQPGSLATLGCPGLG